MSATGRLSPDALHRLSQALIELSHATSRHNVRFDAYTAMNVEVDDVVLHVNWNDEANCYVVEDRFGD